MIAPSRSSIQHERIADDLVDSTRGALVPVIDQRLPVSVPKKGSIHVYTGHELQYVVRNLHGAPPWNHRLLGNQRAPALQSIVGQNLDLDSGIQERVLESIEKILAAPDQWRRRNAVPRYRHLYGHRIADTE